MSVQPLPAMQTCRQHASYPSDAVHETSILCHDLPSVSRPIPLAHDASALLSLPTWLRPRAPIRVVPRESPWPAMMRQQAHVHRVCTSEANTPAFDPRCRILVMVVRDRSQSDVCIIQQVVLCSWLFGTAVPGAIRVAAMRCGRSRTRAPSEVPARRRRSTSRSRPGSKAFKEIEAVSAWVRKL